MPSTIPECRLINGSTGDPILYVTFPGKNKALLFDAGELCRLEPERLADLQAVFITHHHMDHFVGFDRILRANLDSDKVVHIFGPEGTIAKIYQRITSYAIQFFPFQKVIFKVHEVLEKRLRWAFLECARHFPEPVVEETRWKGPMVFDNPDLKVEAVHVDHTVPCLAYALVEKKTGWRLAYVTDTLWSLKVRPRLVKLAKGANRLFCDSYYVLADKKSAATHKHMTATHAAQLARQANVQELMLMHFSTRYRDNYQALVDEARAIFPNVSAEFSREPEATGRLRFPAKQ
jgi:ribonuclease BN (tRNA processing enzyme)